MPQKSLLRAAHVCILTESVSPLGGTLVACEVIQRLHWHISNFSILNVLDPFRNTLNTLWVAIITKYFPYNTQNNRLWCGGGWEDRQHVYFHPPIHTLPLSVVYILAFTWLCTVKDSVAHISLYSVVHRHAQLHGHATYMVAQGPALRRATHLVSHSAVIIFKFLIF